MEKNNFKDGKEYNQKQDFWMFNKNEWSKIRFYWYFGLSWDHFQGIKNVYMLYLQC